jgi:hypothetical protein
VKVTPYLPADRGATRVYLVRLAAFLSFLLAFICSLHWAIDKGLRSMNSSIYGLTNHLIDSKINAQIVITGSSRAASHYDPRIVASKTGLSACNLGRNGSQTDMQLAVLKTYLKHNCVPKFVIHNLDIFSFQTTREVYNPAQYVPYLAEEELYYPLKRINPAIWKSRYVPLYGYAVEDMSFAWVQGLKALLPWPEREASHEGFDPRSVTWSDEFQRFKAENPKGIQWPLEPEGVRLLSDLAETCRNKHIQLIMVYSPEYVGIQNLTLNREQIFSHFRAIATRYQLPFWDYSNWKHAGDTVYFANSEHLNARGAHLFSEELGAALKKHAESQKGRSRQGLTAPAESGTV